MVANRLNKGHLTTMPDQTETAFVPHPDKVSPRGAVVIIGMAGAGKTTIGRELSNIIGWPQIDCDHLIESTYGANLQEVTNRLTKDEFLDLEGLVIRSLKIQHAIISTGGSVVYRPKTMEYLSSLGPIIYIDVSLPIILERIARKPERGLAIAPGQTIEDLYNERMVLYRRFADFAVKGGDAHPGKYAAEIAAWLTSPGKKTNRQI